jgi:hypothetical protein
MKQCTTQQGIDLHHILNHLAELDSLYDAGSLASYEQAWQCIVQEVHACLPGFTVAYAEIYTAGYERNAHGGMRHVLLPLSEGNDRNRMPTT